MIIGIELIRLGLRWKDSSSGGNSLGLAIDKFECNFFLNNIFNLAFISCCFATWQWHCTSITEKQLLIHHASQIIE